MINVRLLTSTSNLIVALNISNQYLQQNKKLKVGVYLTDKLLEERTGIAIVNIVPCLA